MITIIVEISEVKIYGVLPMNKLNCFHGDIKDGNILVNTEDNSIDTRLIDWGISFHWFRTSRLIHFYEKNHDIIATKNFAGHRSINTTMRYLEDSAGFDSKRLIEKERKWEEEG